MKDLELLRHRGQAENRLTAPLAFLLFTSRRRNPRVSPLAIRPLFLALLLVFASSPAVSWANLLSFRIGPPERELVEIDPTTGAGTLLTAVTPTRDILGLAFDSDSGILYGADHVSDSLYIIDPTSGVASLVGAFGVNVANVGLAYDINQDILFMSHSGGSNSKLFSVDTGTGVATQIGADFSVSITGLGYDPNSDTLYGMGSDFNLYTLDTTTGALSAPIGSMGFIQGGGLTYDAATDILYATDSSGNLWTLNTSTGSGTLVGPIGNTFHGALANTSVAPIPPPFDDVPEGYWAGTFIQTLAASGITAGCGNDNYCPSDPVTRAQMAVFLERGINGSTYSPPAAAGSVFNDVGAGEFAASFIEQLFVDGITAGCGNNNYCPDDAVTRAQMAVFLLRAKYGSGYSPPPANGIFNDVDLGYWAVHWIEQLAAEGITVGCGNGNYCPEDPVTRDQMAVFLVRTFGL